MDLYLQRTISHGGAGRSLMLYAAATKRWLKFFSCNHLTISCWFYC